MLGSVSLPPSAAVDLVHSLLTVLANPDETRKNLAEMKAVCDDITRKQKDVADREKALSEREAALKAREDKVAADEASLADRCKKFASDKADLDRRIALMRQAAG